MKKKSILVVENQDSERSELVELLNALGYSILEASDSDGALKSFSESQADLVIVEVLIPGIGGLKVAKAIKEQAPDWVKIIITSKVPQSLSIRDSATRKYKADEFFQKPFELNRLVKTVEALIGPGVPDSAEGDAPAQKEEPVPPPPVRKKKKAQEIVEKVQKPAAKPPEPETTAKPLQPTASASPTSPILPVDLPDHGEFTPSELVKILSRLFADSFTGALQVEGGQGSKQIFFIEGTPVFVQSNIREESLGRLLLEEGRISHDDYREIVEESAETGRKIGSLLIEKNLISSQALTEYLCEQTAVKTAAIFSWPKGEYRIDKETAYPQNASTFEAQPSTIILLAYKKYYPIELIEKEFQRHKSASPRPAGNPLYEDAYKMLTSREQGFLDSLKQHAFGDAVTQAEIGMLDSLRLTYAFVAMGLLSFSEQAGSGKNAVSEAARQAPESFKEEPAIVKAINKLASRIDDMNHFDLLGIDVDADPEKIERGYQFVKDAHSPDKLQPNAPEAIRRRANAISQRLDEARSILSKPGARRRYLTQLVKMKSDADDPIAAARKKKMSAELAYQRGVINFEKEKYAIAAESFIRASQADPRVPVYRAKAGYSLFLLMRNRDQIIKEATELLAGAIKDDRENTDYMAWLAELYREEGESKTALRVYQQILDLDPNHEEARRQTHYLTQQNGKDTKKTKKSLFGRFK